MVSFLLMYLTTNSGSLWRGYEDNDRNYLGSSIACLDDLADYERGPGRLLLQTILWASSSSLQQRLGLCRGSRGRIRSWCDSGKRSAPGPGLCGTASSPSAPEGILLLPTTRTRSRIRISVLRNGLKFHISGKNKPLFPTSDITVFH